MARKTLQAVVNWNESAKEAVADMQGKTMVVYGKDHASPLEILLGSLGGCVLSIVVMLAKKKRMELTGLRVILEGDVDPEGMAKRGGSVRPGFQQIRLKLEADEPADKGELAKLLDMATTICPVRDTLRGVEVIELLEK